MRREPERSLHPDSVVDTQSSAPSSEEFTLEAALRAEEVSAESIVETIHEPLLVLTPGLRVKSANPAFFTHFGVRPEETLGRRIYQLGGGEWDIPALRELLEDVLPDSHVFNDFEVRHEFPNVGRRVMLVNAGRLDHVQLILLGIRDITEQARAEDTLRERDAQQSFLLKLSDALRPLADPVEIQATAARLLGEYLGTDRAYYVENDGVREGFVVASDWHRPGASTHVRRYPAAEWAMPWLMDGGTWVLADTDTDPALPDEQRGAYRRNDIGAAVVVPLIKGGRLVATFLTNQRGARAWTPGEVGLVEETAGRTWAAVEQARAEAALRESEQRLRLAMRAADMGSFRWFVEGDHSEPDARTRELFGADSGDDLGYQRSMAERIHPEDAPRYAEAVARALDPDGNGRLGETIRVSHSSGETRWLMITGQVSFAGGSRLARAMDGVVLDVTEQKRMEASLRESEERHRLIVEGALDYAIMTTAPDGTIESWSPGAAAVFGWTADEAVGLNAALTFTPEDRAAGEAEKEREMARRDGSAPDVRWHRRRDGSRVFIEGVTRALFGSAGELRGFLKVGQDTTERRGIEEALRESEERLRFFGEASSDVLWMRDAETLQWVYLSPAFEAVYGIDRALILRGDDLRNWAELILPEDRERGPAALERVRSGERVSFEFRIRRPDGQVRWLRDTDFPIRDAEGHIWRIGGIGQDITEQKRAEEALRESNETLERRVEERTRELAHQIAERSRAERARSEALRRLVNAEEEERRRISRELHDQMGQQVTGLLLGLRALSGEVGASARLEDLQRLADGIARDIQHMAVELRPPTLDNLGLEAAVRGHLEEWSSRSGVEVDFHSAGFDGARLPGEIETTLYRVAQEGLNNILKHAAAHSVNLVLERRQEGVSMILEDDGAGFDVGEALASPAKAKRIGLRGMRERVALLGGELVIESSPGIGTTLFVRLMNTAQSGGAAGAGEGELQP